MSSYWSRFGCGAVDRINVAARRSDFRLYGQVARYTPRAKGTHGFIIRVFIIARKPAADGDLTGKIGTSVFGHLLRCGGFDDGAVGLTDEHSGHRMVVSGQIHVENASFVVIYNQCCRAKLGGGVGLLVIVVITTARTQHDFSGQVDAGIVIRSAIAVYQDEIVGRATAVREVSGWKWQHYRRRSRSCPRDFPCSPWDCRPQPGWDQ